MHNPYDTFFSKADLKKIVADPLRQRQIDGLPGDGLTAFEIGLQLVDAPVVTVSENFAKELASDLLQTEHFAPHLQSVFRGHPVVGINNGPSSASPRGFHGARSTRGRGRQNQGEVRHALLQILDTYNPPERFGELTYRGSSILGLPEDIPIVVMSGRLDPVQKATTSSSRRWNGSAPTRSRPS